VIHDEVSTAAGSSSASMVGAASGGASTSATPLQAATPSLQATPSLSWRDPGEEDSTPTGWSRQRWDAECATNSTRTSQAEPFAGRRFSWLIEAIPLTDNAASWKQQVTAVATSPPIDDAAAFGAGESCRAPRRSSGSLGGQIRGSRPLGAERHALREEAFEMSRRNTAPSASNPSKCGEDSPEQKLIRDNDAATSAPGSGNVQSLQLRLQLEQDRCAALTTELERRTKESSDLKRRLDEAQAQLPNPSLRGVDENSAASFAPPCAQPSMQALLQNPSTPALATADATAGFCSAGATPSESSTRTFRHVQADQTKPSSCTPHALHVASNRTASTSPLRSNSCGMQLLSTRGALQGVSGTGGSGDIGSLPACDAPGESPGAQPHSSVLASRLQPMIGGAIIRPRSLPDRRLSAPSPPRCIAAQLRSAPRLSAPPSGTCGFTAVAATSSAAAPAAFVAPAARFGMNNMSSTTVVPHPSLGSPGVPVFGGAYSAAQPMTTSRFGSPIRARGVAEGRLRELSTLSPFRGAVTRLAPASDRSRASPRVCAHADRVEG